MAVYRPPTKPILFQIKHAKFNIYPSNFYKPHFVAFLLFQSAIFSKFLHFPLPLLRPLTTEKRAAIKKKAKSNSRWSVTITSETANLDQSCRMKENQ